jgi:FkbM family methyltransferase
MKQLLKNALARLGYSLHRLPPGITTGADLTRDLGLVVGREGKRICIDAGANDGSTIRLIRAALTTPIIHAFEPNPTTFSRLESHHRHTPNVQLVNAGLGDSEGTMALNTVANHALNSFLPLTRRGRASLEVSDPAIEVKVPVHRLDDYASRNNLDQIDLLKIDTQGFELHVLRGADKLFSRDRIQAVMVELNFVELYAGQAAPVDVIKFLGDRGLKLVDFYEKCRHNPILAWCTALFSKTG